MNHRKRKKKFYKNITKYIECMTADLSDDKVLIVKIDKNFNNMRTWHAGQLKRIAEEFKKNTNKHVIFITADLGCCLVDKDDASKIVDYYDKRHLHEAKIMETLQDASHSGGKIVHTAIDISGTHQEQRVAVAKNTYHEMAIAIDKPCHILYDIQYIDGSNEE